MTVLIEPALPSEYPLDGGMIDGNGFFHSRQVRTLFHAVSEFRPPCILDDCAPEELDKAGYV